MIGVTGTIGSGKSTFARLLVSKLEKAHVISGDVYMKLAFFEYKNMLQKMFGPLDCWSDGRPKTRNFNKNTDVFSRTIKLIEPFMNEKIQEVALTHQHQGYNVVIDWSHLPCLEIWNVLDKKYLVYADKNVRLARLQERDDPTGESLQRIKSRIESTWLDYEFSEIIKICNNTSLDDLLLEVNIAYDEIINSANGS